LRQGFVVKRLAKLIEEDKAMLKEFFGQDIDSTAMNPLIKLIEVRNRGLERLWIETGNLFDSTQVDFANERFLEDLGSMMGLERKDAAAATTRLTFVKTTTASASVAASTRIDNNSTVFLKEFETDDNVELPSVLDVVRGGTPAGSDAINGKHPDIFNINGVAKVSSDVTANNIYTLGVDYNVTLVGGFAVEINWLGATEPAAGAAYYVTVTTYSMYVDATAVATGSDYNAQIDEIYNLQIPIAGIGRVMNESSINNGRDQEGILSYRQRIKNTHFLLKNDGQMQAFLNQLHKVQSAKVTSQEDTGHFRSIVYPQDENDEVNIFNECVNEVETRKAAGTQSVAIIRQIMNAGGLPVTDEFPTPYRQDGTEVGTWQVSWVSDNMDGSAPYTEGAGNDYQTYGNYDNEIVWLGGGANPGAGNQYFVKLVKVVEIAETFPLEIFGRLTLTQGYNVNTVSNELFITLNDYINNVGVDGNLYYAEISRIINEHEGVQFVDNLYVRATMRLWKGAAGGTDDLDLNGSGYSDVGAGDVQWVDDEKDQSGTTYATPADYLWDIVSAGTRGIDWSPGGAEPTTDYPYWFQVDIKGDILTPEDVVLLLSGVTFTS
jgi:uncharacterized phage protein gp47/JayE